MIEKRFDADVERNASRSAYSSFTQFTSYSSPRTQRNSRTVRSGGMVDVHERPHGQGEIRLPEIYRWVPPLDKEAEWDSNHMWLVNSMSSNSIFKSLRDDGSSLAEYTSQGSSREQSPELQPRRSRSLRNAFSRLSRKLSSSDIKKLNSSSSSRVDVVLNSIEVQDDEAPLYDENYENPPSVLETSDRVDNIPLSPSDTPPPYDSSIELAQPVYRKIEMVKPGVWTGFTQRIRTSKEFMVLKGTALEFWKHDPDIYPLPDSTAPVPVGARKTLNKLLRSYSLQYAQIGLANDPMYHFLHPIHTPHILRIRAEGEQFILLLSSQAEVILAVEKIQQGINVSLDLEERGMCWFSERGWTMNRRHNEREALRRRRNESEETESDVTRRNRRRIMSIYDEP